MPKRYAILDCEDAEKWLGHEKLYERLFEAGAEWQHFKVLGSALGGRVGRNPSGHFVLQVEEVAVSEELRKKAYFQRALQAQGLDLECSSISIIESHGDQLLQLPHGAQALSSSATAAYEMWCYGEQVLAIQGHPEMTCEVVLDKIYPGVMAKGLLTPDEASSCAHSLTCRIPHSGLLVDIMRSFLGCDLNNLPRIPPPPPPMGPTSSGLPSPATPQTTNPFLGSAPSPTHPDPLTTTAMPLDMPSIVTPPVGEPNPASRELLSPSPHPMPSADSPATSIHSPNLISGHTPPGDLPTSCAHLPTSMCTGGASAESPAAASITTPLPAAAPSSPPPVHATSTGLPIQGPRGAVPVDPPITSTSLPAAVPCATSPARPPATSTHLLTHVPSIVLPSDRLVTSAHLTTLGPAHTPAASTHLPTLPSTAPPSHLPVTSADFPTPVLADVSCADVPATSANLPAPISDSTPSPDPVDTSTSPAETVPTRASCAPRLMTLLPAQALSTDLPATSTNLPATTIDLTATSTDGPTLVLAPSPSAELPASSAGLPATSADLPTQVSSPASSASLLATSTNLPATSTDLPQTVFDLADLPAASTYVPLDVPTTAPSADPAVLRADLAPCSTGGHPAYPPIPWGVSDLLQLLASSRERLGSGLLGGVVSPTPSQPTITPPAEENPSVSGNDGRDLQRLQEERRQLIVEQASRVAHHVGRAMECEVELAGADMKALTACNAIISARMQHLSGITAGVTTFVQAQREKREQLAAVLHAMSLMSQRMEELEFMVGQLDVDSRQLCEELGVKEPPLSPVPGRR